MHHSACLKLAGLVTLGVIIPAACSVFDAFGPPGPRDVAVVYAGDTVLTVGQPRPLIVTVLAEGVPLSGQRLRVDNAGPVVVTLNAGGDSLIPLSMGRDTLVIRLVHSSAAGTAIRDTAVAILKVTGGP